ncbi:MAG: class I SAM-dependent methyltransferase [Acidobacteriota bacterium]
MAESIVRVKVDLSMNLRDEFGDIDIYLFDQILKGRFASSMTILDAGCGSGRNLIYFLRNQYRVFAVDRERQAIEQIQRLASKLAPHLPEANFKVADIKNLPFPDNHFNAVLSSAILHFAKDELEFNQMVDEMWRVLKPEGRFFARLASSIGIEHLIKEVAKRRYLLPDGTERFLVDEEMLESLTSRLGGIWLEPIKTTNVQNLRCMTTWVLKKI